MNGNSLLERLGFQRPPPRTKERIKRISPYEQARAACSFCQSDAKRLDTWRIAGGEFPMRSCTIEHRPKCSRCGHERTERTSGICDECHRIIRHERDEMMRKHRKLKKETELCPSG